MFYILLQQNLSDVTEQTDERSDILLLENQYRLK